MKKLLSTIFVALALTGLTAKAQSDKLGYASTDNYSNSVGLRAGSENGLTFKHFFKPTWAFEGTITTGYRALVATGLVEKHVPIADADRLKLFFGGGGHVGEWQYVAYRRYRYNGEYYYVNRYETVPSVGVDGIFGIEWKIPDAPFTIGADVKPYLDILYPGDSWVEGALSCRYIFK